MNSVPLSQIAFTIVFGFAAFVLFCMAAAFAFTECLFVNAHPEHKTAESWWTIAIAAVMSFAANAGATAYSFKFAVDHGPWRMWLEPIACFAAAGLLVWWLLKEADRQVSIIKAPARRSHA